MPSYEKPIEAPKTGQAASKATPRRPKKKLKLNLFQKKEKAGRQPAPKKAPRRPKRRRRHGRMTLNYLLFGIVGAVIFAFLCYAVFFKVYKIDVTGDPGQYTAQEITTASGLKMKQSLFSVDQKKINASVIDQLPYVQAVNVHKKFPTTVVLEVIPSVPVGAIETEGRYLYINSAGKILESEMSSYDKQKYPLITGLTVNTTQQGNYVLNQNSEQIIMLDTLLKAINASGMENINLIDLGNRLNMRIVYDNRILVELGTEADLDYKLKFVYNTVRSNMSSTAQGVLDVTLIEKWGVFHEADIWELIEQDEQERLQSAGQEGGDEGEGAGTAGGKTGIQVDPNTGAIIVGPKDPLAPQSGAGLDGLSSSEGEGNSSLQPAEGTSSQPETGKNSSSSSSQPEPSSSSPGGEVSSPKDSSSKDASSGKSSGSSSKGESSSKDNSSKDSSSKGSTGQYDKKDYLVV